MGTRHELKVPKTCATWPDAPLTAGCSSPRRLAARAWDDLRLAGLKHPPDPGLGREYEDFYNTHRPHRTLNQATPLRPLPDGVTDLDHFRVRRRHRAGGLIHEYRLVAQAFGTHIISRRARKGARRAFPRGRRTGSGVV